MPDVRKYDMKFRPEHYGLGREPVEGDRAKLLEIPYLNSMPMNYLAFMADFEQGRWRYRIDSDFECMEGVVLEPASSELPLTFAQLLKMFDTLACTDSDTEFFLTTQLVVEPDDQDEFDASSAEEQRTWLTENCEDRTPESKLYPEVSRWFSEVFDEWLDERIQAFDDDADDQVDSEDFHAADKEGE